MFLKQVFIIYKKYWPETCLKTFIINKKWVEKCAQSLFIIWKIPKLQNNIANVIKKQLFLVMWKASNLQT